MNELERVCAWCQAEGTGPRAGPHQSHGICPMHLAEEMKRCEDLRSRSDAQKEAKNVQDNG